MPLYKVKRKLYDSEMGDIERGVTLRGDKAFKERWGSSVKEVASSGSPEGPKVQKASKKKVKGPHVSKDKDPHTKKFIESFDED